MHQTIDKEKTQKVAASEPLPLFEVEFSLIPKPRTLLLTCVSHS